MPICSQAITWHVSCPLHHQWYPFFAAVCPARNDGLRLREQSVRIHDGSFLAATWINRPMEKRFSSYTRFWGAAELMLS